MPPPAFEPETACPEDPAGWREATTIAGVLVRAARSCAPDNPHAVAAFVRGTNHVDSGVLQQSGLAPDAVTKGEDLDGDGDPDVIRIRLEVAELNGGSPDVDRARGAVSDRARDHAWLLGLRAEDDRDGDRKLRIAGRAIDVAPAVAGHSG
ncbi:MAG: hypothetical protein U5O39_12750 [Gammaproteobacteria bacterium]|nr:hypothetical protein [Gammaproteobacteria bacterium]